MTRRRIEQAYLGTLALVVLLAAIGFVWPNYRRAAQVVTQIQALEGKIGRLGDAERALEAQTQAVGQLEARRRSRCRDIPVSARVAQLVRVLSLHVDGEQVADQTFTVSGRCDDVDGEGRFAGLSMVVELDADFDHICEVIDRCESLNRLVRVTGLDISIGSHELGPDRLQASVSIDAIYEADSGGTQ